MPFLGREVLIVGQMSVPLGQRCRECCPAPHTCCLMASLSWTVFQARFTNEPCAGRAVRQRARSSHPPSPSVALTLQRLTEDVFKTCLGSEDYMQIKNTLLLLNRCVKVWGPMGGCICVSPWCRRRVAVGVLARSATRCGRCHACRYSQLVAGQF